ncbi:MAG: MCE family protein [Deltaproteobacteria bacterium]|nr:MCE family protein [Deltaproteobacteria bacterium]
MKKTKEQIQVQVGAFLAIGILLFMAAIFMLGSKTSLFQTHYNLISYFDDISGLRVGAPVQLVGMNVGFIDNISFEDREVITIDPDHLKADKTTEEASRKKIIVKVRVSMKIDTQYQERIRQDSVASVVTQGLLGDRMVYITVGSDEGRVLKSGEEIINVKNPTGFTQLVEKGDDLMIDAKSFVKNTDAVAVNVNQILQEIIGGSGLVHDVIYDPQSAKTISQVNHILEQLGMASTNLAHISGKIDNGKGTLGALVNDDSLYHDIKTLMGKANRNRLIRSIVRYTLQTKDKEQLK